MPTYEEIFGSKVYDTPIENYPEDYLNTRIVYPIKKSKESQTRFGRQAKNRIDQIVEEPERISKSQTDIPESDRVAKQQSLLNTPESVEKRRLEFEQFFDSRTSKQTAVTTIGIGKTNKRGDNII